MKILIVEDEPLNMESAKKLCLEVFSNAVFDIVSSARSLAEDFILAKQGKQKIWESTEERKTGPRLHG